MNPIALYSRRTVHKFPYIWLSSRKFCNYSSDNDRTDSEFQFIEEPLRRLYKNPELDSESFDEYQFTPRRRFVENSRMDSVRVIDVLRQDGPGFDAKAALNELNLRVSGLLVREVLVRVLRNVNSENRTRCAKLAYKFFVWCSLQENYRHTANSYHLLMKIFAETEEYKAMWRLLEEMIENGYPTTARTLNILICTCDESGLAKKVVERFIKLKNFNYRPYKHSFNAVLHVLLVFRHYKLIEWVYEKMLEEGHSPDTLTYNIIMCAKYRLGKLSQFHRLLGEMGRNGFPPDNYTYNILLHFLGKGDKPIAALNLLNHMKEVDFGPAAFHFTTLIDGLSRAGNLDACKYFFDEMIKNGCFPDVVGYTVMITSYVVAGELEEAQTMFDDMVGQGLLPNVYTYNSMIRGLCMAERHDEAYSMLKEMESKGCNPNFVVYNTLLGNLRNAGKVSLARKVVKEMEEKGQNAQFYKGCRR